MIGRRTLLAALAGLAVFAAAGIVAVASGDARGAGRARHGCGTREVYGQTFRVEAIGRGLGCREVERVIGGRCSIWLKREWSCTSLQGSAPFVVWFRSSQFFALRRSPTIVYERYPCSEAKVTPALFALPIRGFPTRRQMLADDVLRCQSLRGADVARVEEILGQPDERAQEGKRFSFQWGLGLERDSLFQIDPEILVVEIDDGHVRSVSIEQG